MGFAAPATAAVTSILVFDDIETAPGTPIGDTEVIPQGYGDLPGLVDARYGAVTALGSAVRRQDDELLYWHGGYSDLTGVAFCCGLGLTGAAEITLLPSGGLTVTLHSVDFGDFRNRDDGSRMLVFSVGDLTQPLYDSGPFDPGPAALTFAGLDIASRTGLLIQWATAYNVGIDNVRFSVTPLPGAGLLLLAAMGLLAGLGRRSVAG